jgi:GT2 family glycosyltransferase
VGVIFLRFNGAGWRLEQAARSVLADPADAAQVADMLFVDNASTDDPMLIDALADRMGDPRVRTLHLGRNVGFSGGINRGVRSLLPEADLVLIINDDASLHPGALVELVNTLTNSPDDVIAVAPKLYLDRFPGIIESVGIAVNHRAEALNVGLGQFDIGQFDRTEPTVGPSFALGLFRRSAFSASQVGPLPEEFFLYYEDVEWNLRANLLGYRSITCPAATGVHAVSASSRSSEQSADEIEKAYAFKHRFIEANLLATAARCFEPRAALSVWAHRFPRLVKARVTGRFPRATFGAAVDAVGQLPNSLRARYRVQRRRVVSDASIFALSPKLPILFDPVTYQPEFTWDALRRTAESASQACGLAAHRKAAFANLALAATEMSVERALTAFTSTQTNQLTTSEMFEHYLGRLTP